MTVFYRSFIIFCLVLPASAQVGTLPPSLRMETVNGVAVPYQHGIPFPSFEKQLRTTVSLAGTWKKSRFNANHTVSLTKRDSAGMALLMNEANGRTSPYYNDILWPSKNIPGVENTLNANEKVPEFYQDGVWYRTKFSLSDSLQQKDVRLKFTSVNYIADVWLNGTYLGWHEGGFTPFAFDVSASLRYDSANVLVVRVDNIPWGTRKDIVPYYECDWFNYTGIIHDVYLEFSDKLSVTRADVVTKHIDGTVDVSVVLQNQLHNSSSVDVSLQVMTMVSDSSQFAKEISAELAGAAVPVHGVTQHSISIPADSVAAWKTTITVNDPKLWSPKKPHLYLLKVTVSQNGAVKDVFYTQFGIRTITTVNEKIYLNGKPVFLHGVARHEDHPLYGRSIPPPVILSDLNIVKQANANYLRTGHYPNHPFTYLAADRVGLLIMEEIPVWWFDETFPWLVQNSVRFIHRQMFREMAFRDRNRPSIGLWSLSNECRDVPGRVAFYQMIRSEIETSYPDGRLLTQSAAADRPGPYDESQAQLDVAGWTMYFGIFYDPGGMGKYRGTKYFTVDAHDYFPKKPIIATEYGYWSGEDMTQLVKQTQTFDSTFLAFEPRITMNKEGSLNPSGFIAGVTWWCIFDWYRQTSGFQSMGLIRMNRDVQKEVYSSLRSKYGQYSENSEYITGVSQRTSAHQPSEYYLSQNFPNPFNPATMIRFSLPHTGTVTMKLYDVLGKEVTTILHERKEPGEYAVPFDASTLSSGIYFYQLTADRFSSVKKMAVVK